MKEQAGDMVAAIYDRIAAGPLAPVWISLVPREDALARVRRLDSALPLYGAPFAVKDNIDVAGLPTTAGCPAYAYTPSVTAPVVQNLLDAGAILIGKTNLDQFATGLVGTRSPYGACSSVFDARYISGGSSAGSAVAVASGLVRFSLGTDTAGSGRVPAAFNNLAAVKPTRGLLSTRGVVPACRSLDCVSIFARTCHDARLAFQSARGFDAADPYSRLPRPGEGAVPWAGHAFRFGVPAADQLEFFGDDDSAALYAAAAKRLEELGGAKAEIDFGLFRAAAELLYAGPWVAERYAAIGPFLESHGEAMDPVVRQIIAGSRSYSAADAFAAQYKLRELRRAAEAEWARMDVLALPTAPTIYTHQAIAADPFGLNRNLGYYTNFVNLMDLAAVAVPAGFRSNGLPFGISLIGPAFSEEGLLELGDRFHGARGPRVEPGACPPGCVALAVVGAHLSGQPLNRQLAERGARLLETARTAPEYRLYALEGAPPPKPGLVRDESCHGPGIEVEIWAVPEDQFGGFVAAIPAPLGIGSVTLADGRAVKCFLAEHYALRHAREITGHGGWRNYLAGVTPGSC